MYSNEDLERFYFQYQTEALPIGESIRSFCLRRKVPYNLFSKCYTMLLVMEEMQEKLSALEETFFPVRSRLKGRTPACGRRSAGSNAGSRPLRLGWRRLTNSCSGARAGSMSENP